MRQASLACIALALVLSLAACGSDNGGDNPTFDIPEDVPEDAAGDVTPGDAEDDADAEETDTGPECTENSQCEGRVTLEDCQEAVCDEGTCVPSDIEGCCVDDAGCDGVETGPCESVSCNTGTNTCEVEAVEGCCAEDADCSDVEAGACDVVSCNTDTNECEVEDDAVEGCCENNTDCADLGDGCCNVAVCGAGNVCEVQELQDCCAASTDCDDGNPATQDICDATCVADGCRYEAPVCEVNQVFTSKGFDDGTLQLLAPSDDDAGDAVGIQVVDESSVGGDHSVYFGDPGCDTYFDGPLTPLCALPPSDPFGNGANGVQLSLTTQQIELNADTGAFLGFWVNMAAEPAAEIPGPAFIATDYLVVTVDDGGGPEEVWKSTDAGALGPDNTTSGEWLYQAANLTKYAGKAVTVRFRFVSDGDADFNTSGGERWFGAYVDSIQVKASCANTACTADEPACPNDNDGCTANTCTIFGKGNGGICAYETQTPGETCTSCSVPGDCGSDACLDYACNEGVCSSALKPECCLPSSDFPEATDPPDVATEGFEDADIADWDIVDPFPDDNVSWQLLQALSYAGDYALYFGDPGTLSYDSVDGNAAVATAWTPSFTLDDDPFRIPVLQFWLFLSTEFDAAATPPEADFDELTVLVDTMAGDEPAVVWASNDAIQGTTRGEWAQVGIDLDPWAGTTVRVGFRFDSIDDASNTHSGARIDELTVTSFCTGDGACIGQPDCDDGDICTTDWCELGECLSEQTDPLCCDASEDCDDGNSCTNDTCDESGTCAFSYVDKTNCCSDGPWVDAWTADFEAGADGFNVETDSPPVTWHVTTDVAADGAASFNFSDPDTGVYSTGTAAATGRLISKPITVPPFTVGNPYAEFDLLLQTEWDDNDPADFLPLFPVDELRVFVAPADDLEAAELFWVSHFLTNTTRGKWLHTRVDLDAWRGQEVRLVFEFDSGDQQNNGYAGPFIDNVGFATSCKALAAVECLYGGDCEASDECAEARCTADFECTEVPKDVPQCCEPFAVPSLTMSFEGEPSDTWNFVSCEAGSTTSETDPESMWQFATAAEAATIPPKAGTQSLYFGNGTDYGGSAGMAACGVAETPTIALEGGLPWDLQFQLYLDIEKSNDCPTGGPDFGDVFAIEVVDAETGAASEIFEKATNVACNEYDKWVSHTVDLTAYAGKSVYFRFSFDSFDNVDNTGKGIAIDDWKFIQGCPAP